MLNTAKSELRSNFTNRLLNGLVSIVLLALLIYDLLNTQFNLNLRLLLELLFFPYIIIKLNKDLNIPEKQYSIIKTGINAFWAIITLIFGTIGFIEIFLGVSLFNITGDVITIIAFTIGISMVLSVARFYYFESDFEKFRRIIKYFSFTVLILNGILVLLVVLTNLLHTSSIHFGNSLSGVFFLDIVSTILILSLGMFGIYVLWQKEEKYEKFNSFLEKNIPGWFVSTLLIIFFFQLFLIQYIFITFESGSGNGLFQDTVKNSIFTGSIYLMLGIGLTMVYKLLNFANFAHGELVIFGSYVSIIALDGFTVGFFFADLAIFIFVVFLSSAILALMGDLFVFRPLRGRDAEPVTLMIASIGLSIAVRFSITNLFGVDSKGLTIENDLTLNVIKYLIIVLAVVSVLLLELLLKKTKIGKAMRAMADNPKLAQISGISPFMVIVLIWIIGAGFAGVGGFFKLLANSTVIPSFGFKLLLPTFAVVILGGIGSYRGAIIAGYIIGFAENFGTFIFIFFRQLKEKFILDIPVLLGDMSVRNFSIQPSFSQEYQFTFGFLILVLVLLIRPTGILGEEQVRER